VVSTQDVSFGTMWTRLVGERARWDAGDDRTAARAVDTAGELRFGQGLVAVWVHGDGPVLVCDPHKALRALKQFKPGTPVEELRAALRAAGAVKHEHEKPRSER
jgi:hypothetical protein